MSILLDDLRAAIRESGRSPEQLAADAGITRAEIDRLMDAQPDLSVRAAEGLAAALGLDLAVSRKPSTDWLDDDAARESAQARLLALADAWAYEGQSGRARRVEEQHIIAVASVLHAVYLTPDSLHFVDYWYRLRLGYTSDAPTNTLNFHTSGRRMAWYRDNLKYKKEPTTKNGPMTLRQIVFEADRTRFIVVAHRRPEATMTEIAITVIPLEGGPGMPEPTRPEVPR